MSLLALDAVACRRGGRLLFEGLSLTLAPGEAALVTGPNGVGKSSLIRLAAGLLDAAAGTIHRSATMALADESLALDIRQPLRPALGFWALLDRPTARSQRPRTAQEAVETLLFGPERGLNAMGIAHLGSVPVRMLSAGQRKRAVLARVIATEAALWLLDEPANGLDAEGQERLEAAMAAHCSNGGAILAASHQPLALPDGPRVVLG